MFEYYFDQGTGEQYKVHTYNLEKFKADFPEAYRIDPFDEEVPLPKVTEEDIKVTEEIAVQRMIDAQFVDGLLNWVIVYDKQPPSQD